MDLIVGSQRPSKRLIEKFNVVEQLKQKNVKAIINLEEPGEHPFCGDGILEKTGFSYDPEVFMNAGIAYFNLYWEDLTAPRFEKCLQIC